MCEGLLYIILNIVWAYVPWSVVCVLSVVLSDGRAVGTTVVSSKPVRNPEKWYENTETNGTYVCMYAVVAAAAAVIIVIVLLLGGSSRRVCVVDRAIGRSKSFERVWVCVLVWAKRTKRKKRKGTKKRERIRVCGRDNKP